MDRLPQEQSHQKWHPLSAMWKPAASTCWCRSINKWSWTDSFISWGWEREFWMHPMGWGHCLRDAMWPNDIPPQSIKVTAVERGSRGRIDPASWLLEEIGISSVTQFYDLSWSNPTTEWMSLYQAIKFMEWSVILNRHMLSFLNSLQLWHIKPTVRDAAFH